MSNKLLSFFKLNKVFKIKKIIFRSSDLDMGKFYEFQHTAKNAIEHIQRYLGVSINVNKEFSMTVYGSNACF